MGATQVTRRGMMAVPTSHTPVHRGTTSATGSNTSVTLACPTGTVAGDIGVMVSLSDNGAPTFPSGFTQLSSSVYSIRTKVLTKVLSAGDVSSGLAYSDTGQFCVQLAVVSSSLAPASGDVSAASADTPASTVADPGTTSSGDTVLRFWSINGSVSFNAGSGTSKTVSASGNYRLGTYGAGAAATGLSSANTGGPGTCGAVRVPHS